MIDTHGRHTWPSHLVDTHTAVLFLAIMFSRLGVGTMPPGVPTRGPGFVRYFSTALPFTENSRKSSIFPPHSLLFSVVSHRHGHTHMVDGHRMALLELSSALMYAPVRRIDAPGAPT